MQHNNIFKIRKSMNIMATEYNTRYSERYEQIFKKIYPSLIIFYHVVDE